MFAVGSPLPEYRIKASTSALAPHNLIHDDEYARRCGYRGALVPGASIFAYMVHSLAEMLRRNWLERGSAEIRLVLPVYEGEELHIAGSLSSISREGILFINCQATNPQGAVCAVGSATLPPQSVVPPPEMDSYSAEQLKPGRTITLQSVRIGEDLRPVTCEFTRQTHWSYCQKTIRDHHPIFQEVIHPGWLLSQTSLMVAANYDLPAWIHVASVVQNFHVQSEDCIVETRGRIRDKFEHKGNHYLVLDLALFVGGRCLQTILHTIIFRIAPRAA